MKVKFKKHTPFMLGWHEYGVYDPDGNLLGTINKLPCDPEWLGVDFGPEHGIGKTLFQAQAYVRRVMESR